MLHIPTLWLVIIIGLFLVFVIVRSNRASTRRKEREVAREQEIALQEQDQAEKERIWEKIAYMFWDEY